MDRFEILNTVYNTLLGNYGNRRERIYALGASYKYVQDIINLLIEAENEEYILNRNCNCRKIEDLQNNICKSSENYNKKEIKFTQYKCPNCLAQLEPEHDINWNSKIAKCKFCRSVFHIGEL